MQTYTEFLMVKKAGDEDDSYLAQLAARKESGDTKAQEALNTMAPGEFGWGLLGAGLGAGGGYLVSRWLRRNGTKRQRAMDMILGALLGGGGTMLLLNTLPGSHGLTQAEMLRARRLYEKENPGNKDRAMDDNGKVPTPPEEVAAQRAREAAGTFIGSWLGNKLLPADTMLANIRLKRVANKLGVPKSDFAAWRNSGTDAKGRGTQAPYMVNGKAVPGGQDILRTDTTARNLKGAGTTANWVIGGIGGNIVARKYGDDIGKALSNLLFPAK